MDRITFKINDVEYTVGPEISSDVTLVDFIRNYAELRGTKYMCREAGCGACIVSVVKKSGSLPMAVNSCMVSITSCHNWEITTIEKLGNRLDGYNVIQKTLAEKNGTQCGYCSPGWIMALHSLLESKKDLTQLEIEKSFGSNICRCTGYRPILEAFKKFAKDSPEPIIHDIEDLKICSKTGTTCFKKGPCHDERPCSDDDDDDIDDWCLISGDDSKVFDVAYIPLKDGKKWYKVSYIVDIFSVLEKEGSDDYMLVCGNTAKGAYPIEDYPKILIDISEVAELKGYTIDQNMIIGANTTLTELLEIFQKLSTEADFTYLSIFFDHLSLVAHIPVRNIGSIAGNLMIKHQHNDFPSDIFLLLETVGAVLTICNKSGTKETVTMKQFLGTDMTGKIILNVVLPPLSNQNHVVTYKIMKRAQNVHAIVNAGFLLKINGENSTVLSCRIIYGGLSSTFIRAENTEKYLLQKNLFKNETLQGALKVLTTELVVVENPPEPSATYRKQLAINLFYKALLSISPPSLVNSSYRSGAVDLRKTRPVSKSKQVFVTDPTLWPLNQPLEKVEALIQCAGEAKYTEDIPSLPREVFCDFALTTVGNGTISVIDASAALKISGVIAFYTAKDIPGLNSFTPSDISFYSANEELLCDGTVKYYNQPFGILVAESRALAVRAAKLVKATYTGVSTPVVDVKDAKAISSRNTLATSTDATDKGTDIKKILKGNFTLYSQYHMMMENLVTVTKPTEEGLDMQVATQDLDIVHIMASRALNLQQNKIDVNIRRLGGAFGMKISRSAQIALACGMVSKKLNRPCRFIQPLEETMRSVGKRLPCSLDYEIGVDGTGKIQYMNYNFYEDNGYIVDELFYELLPGAFNNCYDSSRWNFKCYNTLTDTVSNTWCRSPGTLETIAFAETLMEKISYQLSLDPIEVRLNNLYSEYSDLKEMIEDIKQKSEYDTRKAAVDKYNAENRWKKRGLRTAMMRWTPVNTSYLDVTLSVYHADGTVSISHGGIEMGQGINTKAVQICAYLLKIPVEKVQIKNNNSLLNPNSSGTGGSTTSQSIGIGIQRCCNQLLANLEPVKQKLTNPTWEELITEAFTDGVDLQAHGFVTLTDTQDNYTIYGVTVAEVEVDILTGESEIIRVDVLEDVGQSVNPEVDIGQVEGAFIMGVGYNTSEQLVYNKTTGELLTNRTWTYNVPQARDIPQDFRVYFRPKSYSNAAMFGAKAVAEPPMCMSVVIQFALREAIVAARSDANLPSTKWFDMNGPYTLEAICLAARAKTEDFKFY